jgi:hypothetical protein
MRLMSLSLLGETHFSVLDGIRFSWLRAKDTVWNLSTRVSANFFHTEIRLMDASVSALG